MVSKKRQKTKKSLERVLASRQCDVRDTLIYLRKYFLHYNDNMKSNVVKKAIFRIKATIDEYSKLELLNIFSSTNYRGSSLGMFFMQLLSIKKDIRDYQLATKANEYIVEISRKLSGEDFLKIVGNLQKSETLMYYNALSDHAKIAVVETYIKNIRLGQVPTTAYVVESFIKDKRMSAELLSKVIEALKARDADDSRIKRIFSKNPDLPKQLNILAGFDEKLLIDYFFDNYDDIVRYRFCVWQFAKTNIEEIKTALTLESFDSQIVSEFV